jgi:hypothetical protein
LLSRYAGFKPSNFARAIRIKFVDPSESFLAAAKKDEPLRPSFDERRGIGGISLTCLSTIQAKQLVETPDAILHRRSGISTSKTNSNKRASTAFLPHSGC